MLTQNVNPLKRNSIRKIVYVTATVIIALLLISAIANLLLVRSHYQNYENQQIHEQVKNKALIIGRQLKIYKQVIANLAAEPNTRDLLLFGDDNTAHNWAVEMRKYLPQSIGVALLSRHGEVLGDPVTLRLGPQCMTDLTRLS
ncbi:hypothetical protein, partial [Kaarinaea lacus]